MKKDLSRIIENILLNKIEGLNWYYFNVDFSKYPERSKISFEDIVKKITEVDGEDVYNGDPIDDTLLFHMLSDFLNAYPDLSTRVSRRIFDSNEISNNANTDSGILGKLNRKESRWRLRRFEKFIKKHFPARQKREALFLAEGDSWFQFPKLYIVRITKDIVFNLMQNGRFTVKTLAAAGDWLSNMLRAGDYIEELPKMAPDYLLFSGGGNDIVEGGRIAQLVNHPNNIKRKDSLEHALETLYKKRESASDFQEHIYREGIDFIEEEFINLLNLILVQYFLLFKNLKSVKKYERMIIFTQGYDYPIPRIKTPGQGFFVWAYEKYFAGGKWLCLPLSLKGINDLNNQRSIVYFMIHEFNELLIQLAVHFDNVVHIDCRGVAPEMNDWIDEIHVKTSKYNLITNRLIDYIDDKNDMRKKSIIKVMDKEYSCQV